MAYNYEYPYLDPNVYNDDWLLHEMKRLTDEWVKWHDEYETEFSKLKSDVQELFETLESTIQEEVQKYLQGVTESLDEYKANLTKAWTDFQEKLDGEWDVFRSSISSQQTQFEAAMNNSYTDFVTESQAQYNQFVTNVDGKISDLTAEWKTFESNLQTEWTVEKQELEALKTYINNYFKNLDLSQEVSDKIDEMVSNNTFGAAISSQITNATTHWLNSNITNPSNPPLDSSLTNESAAARAKETGWYIYSLLDQAKWYVYSESRIGFNPAKDWNPGGINISGQLIPRQPSTQICYLIVPCTLPAGAKITMISSVLDSTLWQIAFYKAEPLFSTSTGTFIEGYNFPNTAGIAEIHEVTVPAYTNYIAVTRSTPDAFFLAFSNDIPNDPPAFELQNRIKDSTGASFVDSMLYPSLVNGVWGLRKEFGSNYSNFPVYYNMYDLPADCAGFEFDFTLYQDESEASPFVDIRFTDKLQIQLEIRILINTVSVWYKGSQFSKIFSELEPGKHHFKMINGMAGVLMVLDNEKKSNSLSHVFHGKIVNFALGLRRQFKDNGTVSNLRFLPTLPFIYTIYVESFTIAMLQNAISDFTSIFDDPNFKVLKNIHDTYGTTFSLGLFYEDTTGELAATPTTRASEFKENSHWLKFYMKAANPNNSSEDYLNDINSFAIAVSNFSDDNNLDRYPKVVENKLTLQQCSTIYNANAALGFIYELGKSADYGMTQNMSTIATLTSLYRYMNHFNFVRLYGYVNSVNGANTHMKNINNSLSTNGPTCPHIFYYNFPLTEGDNYKGMETISAYANSIGMKADFCMNYNWDV